MKYLPLLISVKCRNICSGIDITTNFQISYYKLMANVNSHSTLNAKVIDSCAKINSVKFVVL